MPNVRSPEIRESVSASERASQWVFAGALGLILLALGFPEMPTQMLQGILWLGMGLLMLLVPPRVRVPGWWLLLGAGFVVCASLGFLPGTLLTLPGWRMELEAMGLDTGSRIFVQPWVAAEVLAGFAITVVACLYLFGHRVGSRFQQQLALAFTVGVACIAGIAMATHAADEVFGFFPNRNHTATLLAMGFLAGLGVFTQAIHSRSAGQIILSGIASAVCVHGLFGYSESRAGIVLVAIGLIAWVVLTGPRFLSGQSGKAVLLVMGAAIGTFLIADSRVKSRWSDTLEQLEAPKAGETQGGPLAESQFEKRAAWIDGRLPIYKDTLEMIRSEPWTGVGAGQFERVFHQYRNQTNAPNDLTNLHPESDWLWMITETGLASTLCLVVGLVAISLAGLARTRKSRARLLGSGVWVAALIVPLHGLFDVPGHRVGLAWAGALLMATTLRPHVEGGREIPRSMRNGWRVLGAVVFGAGLWLFVAELSGRPALPSARSAHLRVEAEDLQRQDLNAYKEAIAAGLKYDPPPERDPLAAALRLLDEAIRITPLNPEPHFLRGGLYLHYDDKRIEVDQAFAIHRRLVPIRVGFPLVQAEAWSVYDEERTGILWQEALRRAVSDEERLRGTQWGRRQVYERILRVAVTREPLADVALSLADNDIELLVAWTRAVPASWLDSRMPGILESDADLENRRNLFKIWLQRGSKPVTAAFAAVHPEIARP